MSDREEATAAGKLSRRGFIGASSATIVAAACAPAAPVPGATAQPAGAKAGWEMEWDKLITEAKREGVVVVQTAAGAGYRLALDGFTKAFPGIEVEHQPFPDGATYVPKVQGERNAGIYTFDVAAHPSIPPLQIQKHEGVYDPIKPVIFRPDVLDGKVWHGGFEARWADIPKDLAFRHQLNVTRPVYVNTDLAQTGEFKVLDDLLNPKWKGKIVMSDVRQGYVYSPSSVLRKLKGDDWMRRLMVDQQPKFIRDRRQAVEAIVRGNNPLAFGIHPIILKDFQAEGQGTSVKNIEFTDFAGTSGGDVVLLFNRAPHPNAAKLFINWLLTKEGQTAWAINVKRNSARTDVEIVDPLSAPKPGVTYPDPTQEENMTFMGETQKFLLDLVGA